MVTVGDNFTFYLSCDIQDKVSVYVRALFGDIRPPTVNPRTPIACSVVGKLCCQGDVIGIESRSKFAEVGDEGCLWDEWITFCAKYRDLEYDVVLALEVYMVEASTDLVLVGGTTMPLFNKHGRLKTGFQKLRLWNGEKADVRVPCKTPGKQPVADSGEQGRLEQLVKRYGRGEIQRVNWLDRMTLKVIADRERMLNSQKESVKDAEDSKPLELVVELPTYMHAVLYQQATHAEVTTKGQNRGNPGSSLVFVHDPEISVENPAEYKAQKLGRSLTRHLVDRNLKPNTEERNAIDEIIGLPPNKPLNVKQRELFWKFRYYLTSNPAALTKFLKSVDWADASDVGQAIQLMEKWKPMTESADALEMLSVDFSHSHVRSYAVNVLSKNADDEDIKSYLLQLVQALRYENEDCGTLAKFLVSRAQNNPQLAILLHWFLCVEMVDHGFGTRASHVHKLLIDTLETSCKTVHEDIIAQMSLFTKIQTMMKEVQGQRGRVQAKAPFLRQLLSDQNGTYAELRQLKGVPSPFNYNTLLMSILPEKCGVFKSAMVPLRLVFQSQQRQLSSYVSGNSPTPQSNVNDEGEIAVPISPQSSGLGHIFRGVAQFESQKKVTLIYKKGDDLRQDQFVLQMFSLMDRLLKRENYDLKLTPYSVLPTGPEDGIVEFVERAEGLGTILNSGSYKGKGASCIRSYLQQYAADASGPFGIRAEVVENFLMSCAGYCVMTFILGVGDRHFDNIMLTQDGRLFHIDFGFILGREPKPFAPQMRISQEMIDFMGGQEHQCFRRFKQYCFEAFSGLRRHANLILSLIHLMAGSSIQDIKKNPENALLKVQEKFRLDLSSVDEQQQWLLGVIEQSASSVMPTVMERIHEVAQVLK
eukprot:TRINITY_DN11257_c0_g5_i1.p1 TRINITY_DN11257_c0_g5~~TRINITY_DN11257_c0_g5_i1.p1  ORF type:complete len:871 (-),score=117.28 TRINITY_DN11257_c0_g5_i1:1332-3944(-)